MRPLPDPDLSLRDASDFIFDSALGRRALDDPTPRSLANFLREIIHTIYRLTLSCHLPEFTDHGLGHLCSLVDRVSSWSKIGATNPARYVVQDLSPSEAAILLLGILLHDIGMLSQRPEDLSPEEAGTRSLQDVPAWVRSTHISRMERLTRRLFLGTPFEPLLEEPLIRRAFAIARAHGTWPSDWARFAFPEKDAGLAAMLAVADLLDENATRCDSETLLRHRYGSALNCAHWIRHGLTTNRVLIVGGRVNVSLARPPNTDARIEPVLTALRNHYRLVLLYVSELSQVDAGLLSVEFDPRAGLPTKEVIELRGWHELPEFRFQSALVYHLLESFMPEALLDANRLPLPDIQRLTTFGLQPVDLTEFYRIRGAFAPRTAAERSFHALLGI
jgi:hypothetical protein